jgi:transposase-like protein
MDALERTCPECEQSRAFYRAASTELHLGEKTKWHCPDCDYAFVRIDDAVDTSVTAE